MSSYKLTGFCALVMAQVITLETKMNIFRDLKFSISALRAVVKDRKEHKKEKGNSKVGPLDNKPNSSITCDCPCCFFNRLLCCTLWDVVHHHVTLQQALKKLASCWWLAKKMRCPIINGLSFTLPSNRHTLHSHYRTPKHNLITLDDYYQSLVDSSFLQSI